MNKILKNRLNELGYTMYRLVQESCLSYRTVQRLLNTGQGRLSSLRKICEVLKLKIFIERIR